MSAPPQAIAPNPNTNLLNVYIQIANKMGFQKYINNEGPGQLSRYSNMLRVGRPVFDSRDRQQILLLHSVQAGSGA
jgi:hypothetical protein